MTSPAIPTASSLKMRFPEFVSVSDPQVEFAIEEARLSVGDNWTKGADVALVYLAAHYVAASVDRADSGGDGGEGQIASESIGRLSTTYARTATAPVSVDDKSSTSYGRRYLELVEYNFAGATII